MVVRTFTVFGLAVGVFLALARPLAADREPCEKLSPPPPTLEIKCIPSYPWIVGAGNEWCVTEPAALGTPLEFELDVSGLDPGGLEEQKVRAGQFFLHYTSTSCDGGGSALGFFGIEPGEPGPSGNPDLSPFQQEIISNHVEPVLGGDPGLIGYSVGVPFGQPMSACDNSLATVSFAPTAQGRLVIWFREPVVLPSTMLTDDAGSVTAAPDLVLLQANQANAMTVVLDWTPPALTCPPDVTIEAGTPQDPAHTGQATAIDNCDPNTDVAYSDNVLPGPGLCPGSLVIERSWSATDACGNTESCLQVIRVQDVTAPVIACPADVSLACGASTHPDTTGRATATDNDDPSPTVTFADTIVPGACIADYVIERTWTATDWCGNVSTCSQTIAVADTLAPVIRCPADVAVAPGDPLDPSALGEASASDNCDAAPVVTYSDAVVPGACAIGRTIARTWRAVDACGNVGECQQIITVGVWEDCNSNRVPDKCETDADADGWIDSCDECPNDPGKIHRGFCGCGAQDVDTDGDGWLDCVDNCPETPNADQEDSSANGVGDACEPDENGGGGPCPDDDGDGVCNEVDNCPDTPNPEQGELGRHYSTPHFSPPLTYFPFSRVQSINILGRLGPTAFLAQKRG